jgi:hypothetical protein
MKTLAPAPECAEIREVVDGYQLCGRCGEHLVEGESAVVVPRSRSWRIYTHEINPTCPPKAVRGWKAIRFAEAVRKLENVDAIRDAKRYDLGGVLHECVCLLDDKHIKAELKLVEHWPSDESVADGGVDTRVLLNRDTGIGGGSERRLLIRNFIEDGLIAAIDENNLTSGLEPFIECLWSCRRKTYARVLNTPSIETTPLGAVGKTAEIRVSVAVRRTSLPKADSVLSRDVKDSPGEFPLYSRTNILKINGKWISEFECWAPKPDRVEVPYSSITNPELYLWEPPRQLHPKSVDSSNPYGPVARLTRESINALSPRRNEASRGENIQWKASEEKPRTMAASGRWRSDDASHPQRDLWAIRPRLAYLMYVARNHKRKQENQQ